jgi:hypothetical protein
VDRPLEDDDDYNVYISICLKFLYVVHYEWAVHVNVVRLCLRTAFINRPLFIPQTIYEYGAMAEWYWQRKTKQLKEKPIPVPLYPWQNPHGLTQAQNWASVVRG